MDGCMLCLTTTDFGADTERKGGSNYELNIEMGGFFWGFAGSKPHKNIKIN